MPIPLDQAVIVITGASSGIGRAASVCLTRRDSSLAPTLHRALPAATIAALIGLAGADSSTPTGGP